VVRQPLQRHGLQKWQEIPSFYSRQLILAQMQMIKEMRMVLSTLFKKLVKESVSVKQARLSLLGIAPIQLHKSHLLPLKELTSTRLLIVWMLKLNTIYASTKQPLLRLIH
jgi:hypothetical protein